MDTTTPTAAVAGEPSEVHDKPPRPRRRSGPGYLVAALVGAAVAALAVSAAYDDRTLGERVDAGLATASRAVNDQIDGMRGAIRGTVDEASAGLASASSEVAGAVTDASITGSVKAALAADPALSALQIDVTTRAGVVRLEGPAPDIEARERAAVLAAAPKGVLSVDNRLTLSNP